MTGYVGAGRQVVAADWWRERDHPAQMSAIPAATAHRRVRRCKRPSGRRISAKTIQDRQNRRTQYVDELHETEHGH